MDGTRTEPGRYLPNGLLEEKIYLQDGSNPVLILLEQSGLDHNRSCRNKEGFITRRSCRGSDHFGMPAGQIPQGIELFPVSQPGFFNCPPQDSIRVAYILLPNRKGEAILPAMGKGVTHRISIAGLDSISYFCYQAQRP